MGAYLSKPVTEKETESGAGNGMKWAATSMQGWRVNQEDAHNCVLDLHDEWNLFAVYDGHGGSEVARYTADHLPDFLKQSKFWESADIAARLQEIFIDFDDTLRSAKVMKELKKLANETGNEEKENEGEDSEDEADRIQTVEESSIPLEQLLARYGYSFMTGTRLQSIVNAANDEDFFSAAIKVSSSSVVVKGKKNKRACKSPMNCDEDVKRPKTNGEESAGSEKVPSENGQVDGAGASSSEGKEAEANGEDDKKDATNSQKNKKEKAVEEGIENGHKKEDNEVKEDGNGNGKKAGNGKTDKDRADVPVVVERQKKKPVFVQKETSDANSAALDGGDTSDEDDEDFNEAESGEEESDEEVEVDEDSAEGEGGDEEEEEIEDEEEGYVQQGVANSLLANDTPGEDSGTTACVCLINNNKVIVANAGDSRAVLCRDGQAIDLSVDHKPEDDIEKTRIHNAGGTVNEDGRVNGGLNLSRALGDHCYKKNAALHLKEQMISALPDVKMESIGPKDEFLVVACDGIWNSLESQQVVDFVRERLANGSTCEEICEELCDHCLADSTSGDGTGCDNMTIIIALLNSPTPNQTAAADGPQASSSS
ncbi:hypothetical protein WR25_19621 [Diploscapter pachys]|uniref:protein-serine/threonine phosphatase n=1 Tax=Diploscapter pachys TaxID=2018661 RepID=A0A2A2JTJ8_9BILA|nr:hypothetical protein WR25_19621 [Diploscapter pachys]